MFTKNIVKRGFGVFMLVYESPSFTWTAKAR